VARTRRRARFACPTLAQSSTRQRAATPRRYAQIELTCGPRAAQVWAAVRLRRRSCWAARAPCRQGCRRASALSCRVFSSRAATPADVAPDAPEPDKCAAPTPISPIAAAVVPGPRSAATATGGPAWSTPTPSVAKARHLQRRGRRHRFRARNARCDRAPILPLTENKRRSKPRSRSCAPKLAATAAALLAQVNTKTRRWRQGRWHHRLNAFLRRRCGDANRKLPPRLRRPIWRIARRPARRSRARSPGSRSRA